MQERQPHLQLIFYVVAAIVTVMVGLSKLGYVGWAKWCGMASGVLLILGVLYVRLDREKLARCTNVHQQSIESLIQKISKNLFQSGFWNFMIVVASFTFFILLVAHLESKWAVYLLTLCLVIPLLLVVVARLIDPEALEKTRRSIELRGLTALVQEHIASWTIEMRLTVFGSALLVLAGLFSLSP